MVILACHGQHQSEGFAPGFTASRRPMNGSGGASSSPAVSLVAWHGQSCCRCFGSA